MTDYMITRDNAIEALYKLIDSGLLETDLESDLFSIATCIQAETYGTHIWGANRKEVLPLLFEFEETDSNFDSADVAMIIHEYGFKGNKFEQENG